MQFVFEKEMKRPQAKSSETHVHCVHVTVPDREYTLNLLIVMLGIQFNYFLIKPFRKVKYTENPKLFQRKGAKTHLQCIYEFCNI